MEYPDNSYEVIHPYYNSYNRKRSPHKPLGDNHVRLECEALPKVSQHNPGKRQSNS